MQEIRENKGQLAGRISPMRTLETLETGEIWLTDTATVNLASIRVSASRLGAATGRFFSIRTDGDAISITRTK